MNTTVKVGLAALAGAALGGGGVGIAAAAGAGGSSTPTPPYTSMMGGTFGMMGAGTGGGYGMMGSGMMGSGSGMMGSGSGMMSWMWGGTSTALPATIPGAQQLSVTTDNLSFTPSTLTTKAGAAVNIEVRNTDEVTHDFTIPMLGIHAVVQPGQSVSFGLRVAAPGTYPFMCTVAGHAAAGMHGLLVVTP